MIAKPQSELTVITAAKNLCSYIMTVTQKSPKQFRFTFTSRLQNMSLDIIENLFYANAVFITPGNQVAINQRITYQRKALADLKLLCYFANLGCEQGAILMKQFEQIAKLATDCQNLLGAWMNSDRRRLQQGNQS